MATKPFKIYRSSAGSGKTYTLTREYLELALRYPAYFRHILAVTFTNKATAEMKDRMLRSLYDFSKGKSDDMADYLKGSLRLKDVQFQERCLEVLSSILHNYGQFSVSTIDAFFQKVIRSFAKEVGLHGGYQLELDENEVLGEVIDEMLEEIGEKPALTDWLVNFAESKINEGKTWDIKRDILQFAREIFSEAYKGNEDQLYQVAQDSSFFRNFLTQNIKLIQDFESNMSELGQQALEIIESHGLGIEDFSYGYTGVASYFDKISYQKIYEPGKRVLAALDNVEAWYTKSSNKKDEIHQAVENGLIHKLNEAIDYYESNKNVYNSAQAIQKNIYVFGILLEIVSKLKEYKDREGIMLISDANTFLRKIVKENDAPFVYEKVGSFYRNFLIDEFQDTSGFQWDNFNPLIQNSLAEGNKNLVVGDVKQSIYRWRGGDWQLLQSGIEKELGDEYVGVERLDHNYRSAQKLVQLNNHVFKSFAKRLADLFISSADSSVELYQSYAQLIAESYADVHQDIPAWNNREGYASFSFLVSDKDLEISWRDQVLQRIPKILESLQDRDVKINEIAFLVRGSKDERELANFLNEFKNSEQAIKGYNYEVISNESLQLGASEAVQVLINSLQYLLNTDDAIVKANLALSWQQILSSDLDEDDIFNVQDLEALLPDQLILDQKELRKNTLTDLIEALIRIFKLDSIEGELPYLNLFQDVTLEFSKSHIADIPSFLNWWELNGTKQYIKLPENTPAARVMTIHKSKGLQFKAVIIPFCNWKLDHDVRGSKKTRMWLTSKQEPYNNIPFIPIDYGSSLQQTIFKDDYYKEMLHAFMDNLNLLYVALTRAEDYSIVFSETPGTKTQSVSDILFDILESDFDQLNGTWDKDKGLFRFGKMGTTVQRSQAPNELDNYRFISNPWQDKLSVKYKGAAIFESTDHQETGVSYGNLIHDLMSRIITTDQLPKVLETMQLEGLIQAKDKPALSNSILKMFQNETVLGWFNSKWQVRTEVPVLPRTGELSRMDRVMTHKGEAIVVDYKTGMPRTKDIEQVKTYKKLLQDMGFKKVQGFLLYVDKIEVVEI